MILAYRSHWHTFADYYKSDAVPDKLLVHNMMKRAYAKALEVLERKNGQSIGAAWHPPHDTTTYSNHCQKIKIRRMQQPI